MSASPNAAQIAYWNGPIGEEWARAQEKRDQDHAAITRSLIEWAAPVPGEHVLDLGCGTGTTTLLLAERVGRLGRVTGIDLSAPMLNVALARGLSKANPNPRRCAAGTHCASPLDRRKACAACASSTYVGMSS